MFKELTEDQKIRKIVEIFRDHDLTPDIIRQAADLMDPIEEDKDETRPKDLQTKDLQQLELPGYHYLRRKLNMTKATYLRLTQVFKNLKGQYHYKPTIASQISNCSKNFFTFICYSKNFIRLKGLYIGQVKESPLKGIK